MINGKLIREEFEMAKILSSQYENICSKPRESIYTEEFHKFLLDDSDIANSCSPRMDSITFNSEEIKKIISSLNNSAAMGPDGLPVNVYKNGGLFIIDAIMDILETSMNTGDLFSIYQYQGFFNRLYHPSRFLVTQTKKQGEI